MFLRVIFLAAIAHQSLASVIRAGCNIDATSLNPQPTVSQNGSWLYPAPGNNDISLEPGTVVEIGCSGGKVTAGTSSGISLLATCVSGQQFQIDGKTVSFNQIKCSRTPFHTARYTNNPCELNGKEAEIGFLLEDDVFVRSIRLCFDDVLQNTLYSHYSLTASIGTHESGVARPSFIEDDFYNVGSTSVNTLYERDGQRSTINKLVGLSASSTKYVQNSNDYFLSRGHMTAKADFVYGNQQRSTFHYINVAPQWQTFNGGNWNNIEMQVRDYADLEGLDLEVYTGGHGVTTLPHEDTKEEVELYLYINGEEKGIPIPDLYWKVVYNPATKEGVALVGINNPYKTDLASSSICDDISSKVPWITWSTSSTDKGIIYACTIDDLRQTVKQVPELEVTGLLV